VAVVTATDRTREQGKRLRELRERLDLSKGVLIDALSFGSTQTYDLYERGVSVIRFDRVPEWAAAFGISEQEFLDAVLEPSKPAQMTGAFDMPDDPAWDFQAELHRVWPHDAAFADQTYQEHVSAPQFAQKAVVDALRRLAARDQDMLIQESGRAIDEDRSQIRFTRTG